MKLRYLGYSALLHGLLLAALLVWAPAVVKRAAPGIVRVLLLAEEGAEDGGGVPDDGAALKEPPRRTPPTAKARPKPEPSPPQVRLVAKAPPSEPAPRPVARRGTGGPASAPGGGRAGAERDRRIALIQARIQQALFYPRAARRRGIEGTVHVRFGIGQDGRVDGLAVAQSSGHRLLDRASVKTVERAQPFPRIEGALEVPVVFRLTGVR